MVLFPWARAVLPMVRDTAVGQPGAISSHSTPSPHTPQQQLGQNRSPSKCASKENQLRIWTRACVSAYLSYSSHYVTYYVIHLPLNICCWIEVYESVVSQRLHLLTFESIMSPVQGTKNRIVFLVCIWMNTEIPNLC